MGMETPMIEATGTLSSGCTTRVHREKGKARSQERDQLMGPKTKRGRQSRPGSRVLTRKGSSTYNSLLVAWRTEFPATCYDTSDTRKNAVAHAWDCVAWRRMASSGT